MRDPRHIRIIGLTLLAAPLVVVAPAQAAAQEISPEDEAAIQAGPASMPMTVRPQFRDRTEAIEASIRGYPAELRDAGIGGRAVVWFYISDTGRVLHNEIAESSGNEDLNEVALRVAALYQFAPAMNPRQVQNAVPLSHPVIRIQEAPVAVWIQLPITFSAQGPGYVAVPAVQTMSQENWGLAGPVFTPMTGRPEIRNRSEVREALIREYPAALRDAGIGGRAVVWFYISDEGRVLRNLISRSSGNEDLDQAALRVAALFQFTPAMDDRGPVAVWIEVPITFAVR